MTGKEMCEKIAAELTRRTGKAVDPKEVWEMSPTGELFPVFDLYRSLFPEDAAPDGGIEQ